MTTKALFWPNSLENGKKPQHIILRGQGLVSIDWSKAYECWQPDCLDDEWHEDSEGLAYNLILIIKDDPIKFALVWVNRTDFDFIEEY